MSKSWTRHQNVAKLLNAGGGNNIILVVLVFISDAKPEIR